MTNLPPLERDTERAGATLAALAYLPVADGVAEGERDLIRVEFTDGTFLSASTIDGHVLYAWRGTPNPPPANRLVCTLHPPFTMEEMESLAELLRILWPNCVATPDASGAMLITVPQPPPPGSLT